MCCSSRFYCSSCVTACANRMSCCCCCEGPCTKLLEGDRKKERLLTREEPGAGEDELSRTTMDVSLLRARYRSSRDKLRKQTPVLLFRTVSEELSEAVSVIPVTQGLTPPSMTYDPWHVHLHVHRRSRTVVPIQLPLSSSETNSSISSRPSSSSSSACSVHLESSSRKPHSLSSCREMSSCSLSSIKLKDSADRSRGEQVNADRSRGELPVSFSCSKVDPVQICVMNSLSPSKQRSREGSPDDSPSSSKEGQVYRSFTESQESLTSSSDESSTPVVSISGSPSNSTDLHQAWSSDTKSSSRALQTDLSPTQSGSPANRITRHLSVGREGLVTETQQKQNYYPFPSRKTPRISEAAKKLGMYSSSSSS